VRYSRSLIKPAPKLTPLSPLYSDSAAIYVADANGNYLSGFNENVTIPFEAGKTYRLRIINQGTARAFFILGRASR